MKTESSTSTEGPVEYGEEKNDLDDTMNDPDLEALENEDDKDDETTGRGKNKIYELVKSFRTTEEAIEFIQTFDSDNFK